MPISSAPHINDYMGYAHNVWHVVNGSKSDLLQPTHVAYCARREKQQQSQWLLWLEYAKFSLHEKWNNCLHPYVTVSAVQAMSNCLRIQPMGLSLWFN